MIKAIVMLYRFLFAVFLVVALALPIIGALFGNKANMEPIVMLLGLVIYVCLLVIIVGALAVQLDNNRLLTLIAEAQGGKPNSQPNFPSGEFSRTTNNPPLSTKKQINEDKED